MHSKWNKTKRLKGIFRHEEVKVASSLNANVCLSAFDEIWLYCFSSKCVSVSHCVHS